MAADQEIRVSDAHTQELATEKLHKFPFSECRSREGHGSRWDRG